MILVFTRPKCAYCPMVKKFFDMKKIEYQVSEAEGTTYEALALRFGSSVPLVYNPENDKGMTGYNIPKLMEIAGL